MNTARKSQPNAKFRFWSLVWLITLLTQIILNIGLVIVAILLHRWFGISIKVGEIPAFLMPFSYVIAFMSACAIGRRVGFVELLANRNIAAHSGADACRCC